MPCFDARSHYNYSDHERDSKDLLDKINNLTDLLCKVGRAAYSGDVVPQDVLDWWFTHSGLDAMRGEPWPVQDQVEDSIGKS